MHRRMDMRDAFPRSADDYARQVVRLLRRRRADLDATWQDVKEGWTANNERMVESGLSPRTSDQGAVRLNVGGSNVTVSWHLLAEAEGFKDSILGALLEGIWGEGRIPRDADGCIVLDESPVCVKHLIHTMLRGTNSDGAGPGAVETPESAARSAMAADEAPCLVYTAHVMGLPGYVPTHPNYVKVKGGSTILKPFEISPFSAKIREWVGDSTDELTLIYRATRDGFDAESFKARCDEDSLKTVSLIRVSPGEGSGEDSVVGSYSVVGLGDGDGGRGYEWNLWDMFLFMLKDGSATLNTPIKWHPSLDSVDDNVLVTQESGACFGGHDLAISFDGTSKGCILSTGRDTFDVEEDSPFLALEGKNVDEVEVYRCSARAPPTTIAPSTNKPGGDVLTDAEARDVDSFGRSIASSLMEERVVLDRAVKEMEVAGARVSAAVHALETVYGPSVAAGGGDAVVELNVRGTRMTTLRSTLQACPRSALAAMFNEDRWPATDKDKDEHGGRLIDCCPTCFSKILDVLRIRKRASWSAGVEGGKEESGSSRCQGVILVKQADMKAFRTAVNMYFPGCESFIMGLCSVYTTPVARKTKKNRLL